MRILLLLLPSLLAAQTATQTYDIVLRGGRVMDPESNLDAVRNIGIRGKSIAAISAAQLRGKIEIDATGLVVAPGFIDLHQHSQTPEAYRLKAMDGVTTALELEVGASPISEWYAARQGKSLIHFGASAGHIPARMAVMHDTGGLLPRDAAANRVATAEEQRATAALGAMGLSISDAIRLLMLRIADERRLPFEVKVPNAATREAMAELAAGKGTKFASVDALMADLRADD